MRKITLQIDAKGTICDKCAFLSSEDPQRKPDTTLVLYVSRCSLFGDLLGYWSMEETVHIERHPACLQSEIK